MSQQQVAWAEKQAEAEQWTQAAAAHVSWAHWIFFFLIAGFILFFFFCMCIKVIHVVHAIIYYICPFLSFFSPSFTEA